MPQCGKSSIATWCRRALPCEPADTHDWRIRKEKVLPGRRNCRLPPPPLLGDGKTQPPPALRRNTHRRPQTDRDSADRVCGIARRPPPRWCAFEPSLRLPIPLYKGRACTLELEPRERSEHELRTFPPG